MLSLDVTSKGFSCGSTVVNMGMSDKAVSNLYSNSEWPFTFPSKNISVCIQFSNFSLQRIRPNEK